MLSIALELRQKYSPFRRMCQELELVLYDPGVSVQKKMRAVAEIDRVVKKLWGGHVGGVDRYIRSTGSLADSILNFQDEGLSVEKITDHLVSAPAEYVIEKIRNRKYRLLFDARDSFLRQESVEASVSRLFATSKSAATNVNFMEISHEYWWESHLGLDKSPSSRAEQNRTMASDDEDFDDDIPF